MDIPQTLNKMGDELFAVIRLSLAVAIILGIGYVIGNQKGWEDAAKFRVKVVD